MMASIASAHSRSYSALVPALDPEVPYYSRLSARSALFTDLCLLLEGQEEAVTVGRYRALVMDENRLVRSSTTARRKTWKELKSRYRLDATDPLFAAFWTEWKRSGSDQERALTAYVLLALNDRLVADLGTEWLFPLLRRAAAEIRVEDVRAFLNRAERAHPEISGWSEKTTLAVAQKYCASVRDFGLAQGTLRKTTVRPALYGAPVRLLLRALCLVGTRPRELVQAHIFRLLAIDSTEVVDALAELHRLGAIRFRMQGDVIELDFMEST